jgi:hypothetical protein
MRYFSEPLAMADNDNGNDRDVALRPAAAAHNYPSYEREEGP